MHLPKLLLPPATRRSLTILFRESMSRGNPTGIRSDRRRCRIAVSIRLSLSEDGGANGETGADTEVFRGVNKRGYEAAGCQRGDYGTGRALVNRGVNFEMTTFGGTKASDFEILPKTPCPNLRSPRGQPRETPPRA